MYYIALAVIPPTTDPTDEQAVRAAVERVMAPFSDSLTVPPWKSYLADEHIDMMCDRYGVAKDDLAALVERLPDRFGSSGGVDERGLFYWTTCNPCGVWDSYTIGGRWSGLFRDGWGVSCTFLGGNALRLRDVPPYSTRTAMTAAVVLGEPTPTLLEMADWDPASPTLRENPRYAEQVADICRRYPEHIGVAVAFHF